MQHLKGKLKLLTNEMTGAEAREKHVPPKAITILFDALLRLRWHQEFI